MAATIGIRYETKSSWERRTPLVPDDVGSLIAEHGLEFVVEPSEDRAFTDSHFSTAGAEIDPGLSRAGVVFGVKEIPPELLEHGKTYVFFSHVIKGQPHNMPMLRRLLELECTLVDYERIVDAENQRLVFFGREAGQAGMIETLHALGRRLAWEGWGGNPFARVRQPHEYSSLAEACAELEGVAGQIARAGLETDDLPLVVGFTGCGRVSLGAQELFDLLPHEEVGADELAGLAESARGVRDRIFKVVFEKRHLARPKAPGKVFDPAEYKNHPERYESGFQRYLPYLTVLINGIFWTDDYPRLLTRAETRELWRRGERKLRVVGDVTCDVDGAVELTYRVTQPDRPTYVYLPEEDRWNCGVEGDGVVVLAIDNLPCELPREASEQFSQALYRFVPAIARADYTRPFAELDLPPEIRAAVIAHRGELTPDYRYLEQHLALAAKAV